MARAITTAVVTSAEAEAWCRPRHDILHEVALAPGPTHGEPTNGEPTHGEPTHGEPAPSQPTAAAVWSFGCATGPFRRYERRVELTPDHGDRVALRQEVTWTLALPVWSLLYALPVRRGLRRRGRDRAPWWAPPKPVDERSADVLARLCTLSVISGYLGTLIAQTITFASDEFDASTRAQGTVLALTRIGVLFALVLLAVADRSGRRRMVLWGTAAACAFTVLGAASPSLWSLGVSQTVARGLTTGQALLLVVIAAEEVSAGARAYAVSVLALTAALGAGMAVWILPVADVGEQGWRILYLVPVLALPLVARVARGMPETRRFEAARARAADRGGPAAARPSMPGGRLALLAATSFLVLAFRTPASQLQNEFLKDHRGYDAARISLFTIVTSTPAGLGVLVGGRLADVRGRRAVSALGLAGGAVCMAVAFASRGWALWTWELVGVVVASLTVPALGSYGPELFATRTRGRANGVVAVAGVLGSSLGLVLAGVLVDRSGFGTAMAVLAVGPLLAAALVWVRFPETAQAELEDLNPDDRPAGPPGEPATEQRSRSGPHPG